MRGRKNLLIITQVVDPAHSNLGFFCEWISTFAKDPNVATVEAWCLHEGEWKERPTNVIVRPFPSGKLARVIELYRRIFARRYDGVFVHMTPIWVALAGWWWRVTRQPIVLWYTHGTATAMLRVAMVFANHVATATAEAFPVRSSNVIALGHGVAAAFGEMKRSVRFAFAPLQFICVGRLTARKRVLETLDFFSIILRHHPDAHFTWMGAPLTDADRAYEETVRQKIHAQGLDGNVTLLGAVRASELPERYAEADLFAHLSATGSLDKVVLEAVSAGCPIFSTNPATREVLPEGFWADGLDDVAAREAIRRAQAGLSEEMREDAIQRFSLARLVSRIVGLFADV